jgi:hypothetical protein
VDRAGPHHDEEPAIGPVEDRLQRLAAGEDRRRRGIGQRQALLHLFRRGYFRHLLDVDVVEQSFERAAVRHMRASVH